MICMNIYAITCRLTRCTSCIMRAATRRTAPYTAQYCADFAALIAPVSISLFDAALRGAVQRAV